MDDRDDLLEPFQKTLLRKIVAAWKRSREPFSATSIMGWPKTPFRHPGLAEPLPITKFDFDSLAELGFVKISKPLYEGDLYDRMAVEFSVTNPGVLYAERLEELERLQSGRSSRSVREIETSDAGEARMQSDEEIDRLLTGAERDLVHALYSAWEIEPNDFIFPPFDPSKLESISQVPDLKTRVSATFPHLRHLSELGVVNLRPPLPKSRKGSTPGWTVESTVVGRRYHEFLNQGSVGEEQNAVEEPVAVTKHEARPEIGTSEGRKKPRVFIGSSVEGLRIAQAVQAELEHDAECTIWSQGVFGLMEGSLESLVKAKDNYDFAILALTPDDLVTKRKDTKNAPRDNVLFELGFFIGAFGRERVAMIHSRDREIALPSDLAGITPATFSEVRQDGNLQAALGPACTTIRRRLEGL